MKKGDRFYRTLPESGRLRVIELLDANPEEEYLLKIKYTDDGKETRLNKTYLIEF